MDALSEIAVFVRVVDTASFTQAGHALGLTRSGVSRAIARLEARLGVRLLHRTTRSLSLTADGAAYHARCARIVAELEDADLAMARARSGPRGRLRVDAPTVLGHFVVGPSLPRFLETYPDVAVDLSVRDHLIDPIAEGIDVVLRMAELRESELVSKKLGVMRVVVVAAPAYLARRGRPRGIADLRDHVTIGFLRGGAAIPWRLRSGAGDVGVAVSGRLHTDSVEAMRRAAVAGLGLIQVFEAHVAGELQRGALEVVLRDAEPRPRTIYALHARSRFAVPKVRAFLDFFAARFAEASQAPVRRR
jgi:DNA-binding transcriptional LysR family regulator